MAQKDYFIVEPFFSKYSYSDYEKKILKLLLNSKDSITEKDFEGGMICNGEAALDCLFIALNRPTAEDRRLDRPHENAFRPNEELFGMIVHHCDRSALDYFVKYNGRVVDCGVFWDIFLENDVEIRSGQPVPEEIKSFMKKITLLLGLCPISDSGQFVKGDDPRAIINANDPVELILLHKYCPDFRVEKECADALLKNAVFYKFRVRALGINGDCADRMLECWKLLSPQPYDLTCLDEFFAHIHDEDFEKEIRGRITL